MEYLLGVTSDHDLINLADKINVHIDQIYELSEIKQPLPRGSYLILIRTKGQPVGHWCSLFNDVWFDSMGVGPPTVLGELKYNQKQYQSSYAEYCGIYALLFLYTRQKNKPQLWDGFTDLDIDIIC